MVVQRSRPPGLKFKPFGLEISAPWLPRPPKAAPRRLGLNAREQALAERIKRLKKEAGSHSPSAWTLAKLIPELRLKVDACFLSNPYATELFLMHFHREVIRPRKLRKLLELYPSQNRVIAGQAGPGPRTCRPNRSSSATGPSRSSRRSSTGSPATRSWSTCRRSRPTTSSPGPTPRSSSTSCRKDDDFRFDPDAYLELVRRERPDTVVLINPNNPDGGYIPYATLVRAAGRAARRART